MNKEITGVKNRRTCLNIEQRHYRSEGHEKLNKDITGVNDMFEH